MADVDGVRALDGEFLTGFGPNDARALTEGERYFFREWTKDGRFMSHPSRERSFYTIHGAYTLVEIILRTEHPMIPMILECTYTSDETDLQRETKEHAV